MSSENDNSFNEFFNQEEIDRLPKYSQPTLQEEQKETVVSAEDKTKDYTAALYRTIKLNSFIIGSLIFTFVSQLVIAFIYKYVTLPGDNFIAEFLNKCMKKIADNPFANAAITTVLYAPITAASYTLYNGLEQTVKDNALINKHFNEYYEAEQNNAENDERYFDSKKMAIGKFFTEKNGKFLNVLQKPARGIDQGMSDFKEAMTSFVSELSLQSEDASKEL